ncbi:MAG: serine hydrolase domain-containing protein [Gemmatimonadota bacterium]
MTDHAGRFAAQVSNAAPVSAPALDSAQLVARVGAFADSLARAGALSGVVLLAKNGAPIFEHAYGLADRERKVPNSTGTAFNLSSIGKRFTQTAVAQLVAAGRLSLDSTIASVWPDYPNKDVARQVTIRELLDHRSGIGGDIFRNPEKSRSNHDYLALFVNDPLRFQPGTREEYSNAGYIVLGEIVARVSHEDYYAYVKKHVFDPAGMSHTGFYASDSLPAFAACGYTRQSGAGTLVKNIAIQPRRGSAGGGSYATAADLLRFIRFTRDAHTGFPPDSRRSMIAGGSPGSNGVIAEGLPGGYDLIVLENLDPPSADAVVEPVLTWLGAVPPGGLRRVSAVRGSQASPAGGAKIPDTPAGRIVGDYLRAYNSGDPAVMGRFFESEAVSNPARPTSARVETYKSIFADNGKLEVTSVDEATPKSVRITARDAQGGLLSMTFTVDSVAPNRLESLRVERNPD